MRTLHTCRHCRITSAQGTTHLASCPLLQARHQAIYGPPEDETRTVRGFVLGVVLSMLIWGLSAWLLAWTRATF
jgi:hypothetical protein